MATIDFTTNLTVSCDTKSQREDAIALCELLELKMYGELWDFEIAPFICIYGCSMEYQPTSQDTSIQAWRITSHEFIKQYCQ